MKENNEKDSLYNIIGITLPSQGLITLYKYVVSHILYAEEKDIFL